MKNTLPLRAYTASVGNPSGWTRGWPVGPKFSPQHDLVAATPHTRATLPVPLVSKIRARHDAGCCEFPSTPFFLAYSKLTPAQEITVTTRDRIDPESRIPLEGILSILPGGFNSIPDIVQRRETVTQILASTPIPKNPNIATTHYQAPGPAGDLAVRVYTPQNISQPSPGLIYIHGGGMIMGGGGG